MAYTLSELKKEAEWRKCCKNERYFLENYWNIAHPAHGRILFDLRSAQAEALEHWQEHRYSLTLKARQIGWSTLVAAHQFWLAFFHADQNIIDLSRTEREAVLLLRKTKYGFKHLPDWMLERGPKSLMEHQQRMGFDNGSLITSMPSASVVALLASPLRMVVGIFIISCGLVLLLVQTSLRLCFSLGRRLKIGETLGIKRR